MPRVGVILSICPPPGPNRNQCVDPAGIEHEGAWWRFLFGGLLDTEGRVPGEHEKRFVPRVAVGGWAAHR
jgi:hypothetical protein